MEPYLLPIHVQLQQHPYRALEFQSVQFVVGPGPGTTLARHDGGVVLHSRHGLVPGTKKEEEVHRVSAMWVVVGVL